VPFAQGSFLVIQTDLYKQLKGFDDRFFMYMEDADLCKRVNEVSVVRYFPDTAVVHKWEKGSHKSMKLFKIHLQSMYRYFKKWGFR
jgi:GT2 family glycosyltransferase